MIKVGVVTENALKEIRRKMNGPAHQGEDRAPVQVGRRSKGTPADIARDSPGKAKRRALRKGDMCVRAIHDALSSFAQERASRDQRGWQ